ncbi:hypothetical protein J3F83DRAFT_715688 [Trichoderma novae-zelandiae]
MVFKQWLLQINISLSALILLPGSQQSHFSWAPAVTFAILSAWGLTGMTLAFLHRRHLLENPQRTILYPLQVWLPFVMVLQTSLAEAILLLPLATTAAMIFLAAQRNDQGPNDDLGLPIPVPGPRRLRFRPAILLPDAQNQ